MNGLHNLLAIDQFETVCKAFDALRQLDTIIADLQEAERAADQAIAAINPDTGWGMEHSEARGRSELAAQTIGKLERLRDGMAATAKMHPFTTQIESMRADILSLAGLTAEEIAELEAEGAKHGPANKTRQPLDVLLLFD